MPPSGLVAALLAFVVLFVGGLGLQGYAARQARRLAPSVAGVAVANKLWSLTLQRAALVRGDLLPIYGSSELYCCGDPYRPTQVFASQPTGFDAFAIGRPGVDNLLFLQMFGALGPALAGRRLVIIDSPPWFDEREPQTTAAYTSNFSPGIADAFLFTAPLSLHLRRAVARRMLAYPGTLEGDGVLRLAVHALARPTPLRLAAYATLEPLGRLEAWMAASCDAVRTIFFLRRHRSPRAGTRSPSAPPDWTVLAEDATALAERRDTTNPFGFPDGIYASMRRYRRVAQRIDAALALYQARESNADGEIIPPEATGWGTRVAQSAQWGDLRLAAATLQELGVHALLVTLPMPGHYYDYTPISAPLRRTYYERWEHVTGRTGLPSLDFRSADEDPYFLTDTGGHLSPRGWIFADRALTLFWSGSSIDEIRAALAELAARVPAPPTVLAAADHRNEGGHE